MKVVIILCFISLALCLDNGLGLTPPMGWNSWNKFACSISEDLAKQVADSFITTGLAAAGYQFINLDDCWQSDRNATTNEIIANPDNFPSGIKALADYIHGKGLKFGLYSDAGTATCQGKPGSLGYEDIDASTYASWDVDYLKYDNCNNQGVDPQIRYPKMRDALNKTGKPIYYSICEWQNSPWTWAPPVGNSWRNTDDIGDSWRSTMSILDQQPPITSLGGPGHWNDPDMLEVGNGGQTTTEYESHFALWAFLKAPLIIGCDTRNMSNDTLRILTNTEIIAVNQDPLGIPASQLNVNGTQQLWGGPIVNGYAAILFNAGDDAVEITANFTSMGLLGRYHIRDLYAEKDLGYFIDSFSAQVESHGVVVIKLREALQMEESSFLQKF